MLGDEHYRLDKVETVALRVDEIVGGSSRLEAATALDALPECGAECVAPLL